MSEAQTHRSPRMKRNNAFRFASMAAWALYTAALLGVAWLGPRPQEVSAWLFYGGVAAALFAMGFTFARLGALDEVALQAHKNAWFWGGQIGLALSLAAFLIGLPFLPNALESLIAWRFDDHPRAIASERAAFGFTGFALGFVAAAIPPALCTMIWWAAFWLRRR